MEKTSEKVTKDPKHVEAARKGREKYMNKLKESILNDVKKGSGDTTNASSEATSATNNANNETSSFTNTATTGSNDTYVYGVGMLLSLPLVLLYFLHITLPRLKIKKPPMKNKINHKNDVICF